MNKKFSHYPLISSCCIILSLTFMFQSYALSAEEKNIEMNVTSPAIEQDDQAFNEYLDFFEEIYKTMDDNYYRPIPRAAFEAFVKNFKEKIYVKLKDTGKSVDFIRWRSAAFMLENLRASEDVFSAFYPPKPAKEYQETSLGKRIDLGIDGLKDEEGFRVTFVEPRSDAYLKGLRSQDVLVTVNREKLSKLNEQRIRELLSPLDGSTVKLTYLSSKERAKKKIKVLTKEYFKQTVFPVPTKVKGIYGLKIDRFNRKTSEDMLRYLEMFKNQGGVKGFILDLRDNPGGPPLAAREISAFFLEPGSDFAYFQKKNQPKALLDVPVIPQKYRFDGPMVILVNNESGSAAELFSGILQKRKRAVLMGENSAGQVMLKSMFHFDDESMVLLITSKGHHADGSEFSFGGLIPDRYERDMDEAIVDYATKYLVYSIKNWL